VLRIPDKISESLEIIFGLKVLSLMRIRIRDPDLLDVGSGMEKIRIRGEPRVLINFIDTKDKYYVI
jgi:hypothetical protein